MITRRQPIDGYALKVIRLIKKNITAQFWKDGRLFLFMLTVNEKTGYAYYYKRKRKKVFVCNILHKHHPLARAKSVTATVMAALKDVIRHPEYSNSVL